MCGRYASTQSAADLSALFESVDETRGALAASYNIAPTDTVPLVRVSAGGGARVLSAARWGLVPSWAKDRSGAARMINARAETVATSRAFGRPFARQRALIPADGWYEWRRGDGGTQPYFMTSATGGVLAFAGVWSRWGEPGNELLTCSVLTVAAVGELADIHDRMPLILSPHHWDEWLGAPDPQWLLIPDSAEYAAGIVRRAVGRAVGNVRNNGPELIRAVAASPVSVGTAELSDPTLF